MVGALSVVFLAAIFCVVFNDQPHHRSNRKGWFPSLELTTAAVAGRPIQSAAPVKPAREPSSHSPGAVEPLVLGTQPREASAKAPASSPATAAHKAVAKEDAPKTQPSQTMSSTIAAVVNAMVGKESQHSAPAASATDDGSQGKEAIPPKLTKELSHVITRIVQDVVTRKEKSSVLHHAAHTAASASASQHLASESTEPSSSSEQQSPDSAGKKTEKEEESAPEVVDAVPLSEDAARTVNETAAQMTGKGDQPGAAATAKAAGYAVGQAGPVAGLEYKPTPLTYLAWFVAALSVVLTMVISTTLIVKHLDYYESPHTQKYVVRILFMAPIYAVDSLLALTFVGWTTTYIDVFRDCYEAFTIYNFFKLLVVLLGDEKAAISMMGAKPQAPMLFPLCWVEAWDMGPEMFYGCKYGALQYVLVKPTCAIVTFVSGAAGLYGARTFSLARLHFYVFFFSNTSQVWALYCLFTFYQVLKAELAPHQPVLKFVIVKAVVFFCFWQGVALGIMAYLGYVPSSEHFSSDSVVEAIQELLVCIEMVIVSILFHFAFPVEEFADVQAIDRYRQNQHPDGLREHMRKIRQNVSDPFKVADIRQDIHHYGSHTHEQLYGAVADRMEGLGAVSSRFVGTRPTTPTPTEVTKASEEVWPGEDTDSEADRKSVV